ncbi:MAG TPA: NAD-dependent epimerase/dehydratase family protein [Geminicoccaceae bacterium]|nr:NAD-dependent epimerase/dehydratase family protein [Geminicoccaceae bacterium]
MRVFVTGASGYIGGSVAVRLLAEGHQVSGLVRSGEAAAKVQALGITPIAGTLADRAVLIDAARTADAVVNAANSDNRDIIEAILPALAGTGKLFLQTSGSSIVGDNAGGEPSDKVYDEDTPVTPLPDKAERVAINDRVRAAAGDGVRGVVLCPTLIYGIGHGVHKDSIQVPKLIGLARKSGGVRHVGRGLNVWSNVHIDDLVDLYVLAIEKAQPGSFFYAENGEASMKALAEAISRLLGFGGRTEAIPLEDAVAEWGGVAAAFTFGSNSRVRARRARADLGWRPHRIGLLEDVEHGSYAAE